MLKCDKCKIEVSVEKASKLFYKKTYKGVTRFRNRCKDCIKGLQRVGDKPTRVEVEKPKRTVNSKAYFCNCHDPVLFRMREVETCGKCCIHCGSFARWGRYKEMIGGGHEYDYGAPYTLTQNTKEL